MHSSSVAPIDENQLFYLMSRGLSEDEARKAIVLGFLEPVVARIPLPEAQDATAWPAGAKWPEAAAGERSRVGYAPYQPHQRSRRYRDSSCIRAHER